MTQPLYQDLSKALAKIDRPGSFCVSGQTRVVLPGLEVAGLGPIGLPLSPQQAEELKSRCEQAPYGKGEETLVDPDVRRVWRLNPSQFSLTNPDWDRLLQKTVRTVQEELGLERQKLQSHLYELLLYEPGSFFLPHRDGEKLDRMVATLVIVLPSSFQGGELVVRHEGQEQVVDFGGDPFHIHYAAFYADCEHEIRPLREGHRLCLVYNLTLARATKKPITAPRSADQVESIAKVLRRWKKDEAPSKLVVTLGHQYTEAGLSWDALKGVDRAQAQALVEGARQAGCQAYLALLTLHETGSAEGDYDYYPRRRRWHGGQEDEPERHEMGELLESSLSADHLSDPAGHPLPVGELPVEEDELLDPEALRNVVPEEEFEGYTGNAGMTLDRWYRHAAIILWPADRLFEVLCEAGIYATVPALVQMVKEWQESGTAEAADRRAACLKFAAAIIEQWPENPYGGYVPEQAEMNPLFPSLAALDEPGLIKEYLRDVLTRDPAADPSKSLAAVCRKHGWGTFRPELEAAFQKTTAQSLARNVRLLEALSLDRSPMSDERRELCQSLAASLLAALERIDQEPPANPWERPLRPQPDVLAAFARSLLATEQCDLLSRVVSHVLALPQKYPLHEAHLPALANLQPWLAEHVTKSCPALSEWLAAVRRQLEALTAAEPQPPADYRRAATTECRCSACAELRRFLNDPHEAEHRFPAVQERRSHLEHQIRGHHLDLDLKTETRGRPYTLVCTKNTASYQAELQTYRQNQEHLAGVRAIEASLPQ